MKIEKVAKLKPIERLCYFIKERESIRLKKEAGEKPPWTDDEILGKYKFTNVRRMDDKVSQWLLKHWLEPYFDHKNILPAIALARFINKPNSLECVGFPKVWKPDYIKNVLMRLKRAGPIFNGAYMVRGNDGVGKVESVVDYYVQPLVDNPPCLDTGNMEACHTRLMTYHGMGSFMAGQIVADLRWAKSGLWLDRFDWAPMGPGSKRGMNRLHERELKYPLKQAQFLEELTRLWKLLKAYLPNSIMSRMELMDWQNCMCEFDKYSRALDGTGKPKQLYRASI